MEKISTETFLVAVLSAISGLLIAVFSGGKKVVDAYFERAAKRVMDTKYVSGLEGIAAFHRVLEEFKKLDFVDRMLIFRGSNCGGTPDPKRPYNVRCFFGWSKDPTKRPEDNYNFDMVVDSHYMDMLLDVVKKTKSSQITTAMPEHSRLRNYYINEGVFAAEVFFLSLDQNEMLYLSIASYKREFTKAELISIDLIVDRARACLASTNGTLEQSNLF